MSLTPVSSSEEVSGHPFHAIKLFCRNDECGICIEERSPLLRSKIQEVIAHIGIHDKYNEGLVTGGVSGSNLNHEQNSCYKQQRVILKLQCTWFLKFVNLNISSRVWNLGFTVHNWTFNQYLIGDLQTDYDGIFFCLSFFWIHENDQENEIFYYPARWRTLSVFLTQLVEDVGCVEAGVVAQLSWNDL